MDDLLTDKEYFLVCIQAAMHTNWQNLLLLKLINRDRFTREEYECICRTAVLHKPNIITGMHNPTAELCLKAAQLGAALIHIPEEMRTSEICLMFLQKNRDAEWQIKYIPEHAKDEKVKEHIAKIEKEREEKRKRREEKGLPEWQEDFIDDIPF